MVMSVATVPACADLWAAKTPYELAQGLQIAECLQMTSESRALYFNNNSPLASVSAYAKLTEASVIRVMAALAGLCSTRRQAFVDAAYKQLTCSPVVGVEKAALTVSFAESVRADLDSKKSMRSEAVIVLGGQNAEFLSNVLGAAFVEAATVPELRQFFDGTHLQATVQRIFIWLDLDHDQVKLAQQSQLVPALYNVVIAAANWRHVNFVVLPVPYAHAMLPQFHSFMHEFNKYGDVPHNVLWLSDAERFDGARFAHSLGSNALVTDFTAVDERGYVSRKSARAALRFIRSLKPHLVPEQVDLSDPPPKQQHKHCGIQPQSSSSSAPPLHGVRHGYVHKHQHGNNTSRDAPFQRGGAGGYGKGNNKGRNNQQQGQGSRRRN